MGLSDGGTGRDRAMAMGTENEGDYCGCKRTYGISARDGISVFGEMAPLWKEEVKR